MDTRRSDPLVTVLRFIIGFAMGAIGFAMIAIAIGFVAVPFLSAEMTTKLSESGIDLARWQAVLLIEGMLAGVLFLLALMAYFFLLLWRILATVREGDPFAPDNAARLSRMAWTSLAGNLWVIVLAAYAAWFETFFPNEMTEVEASFDFGGGGLVLILVLFVLARVFRQGTAMREDLEGTV